MATFSDPENRELRDHDDMLQFESSELDIDSILKSAEVDLDAVMRYCDSLQIPDLQITQFEPFDVDALLKRIESENSTLMTSLTEQGLLAASDDNEPYDPLDPNLTARDAAEWMRQEVDEKGFLDHDYAVSHLCRYFGQHFTRLNDAGNNVIALGVLKEFAKRTPHIVWSRHQKQWRQRYPEDPEGRLVE